MIVYIIILIITYLLLMYGLGLFLEAILYYLGGEDDKGDKLMTNVVYLLIFDILFMLMVVIYHEIRIRGVI